MWLSKVYFKYWVYERRSANKFTPHTHIPRLPHAVTILYALSPLYMYIAVHCCFIFILSYLWQRGSGSLRCIHSMQKISSWAMLAFCASWHQKVCCISLVKAELGMLKSNRSMYMWGMLFLNVSKQVKLGLLFVRNTAYLFLYPDTNRLII